MERKELKNYVFENILDKVEGVTLQEIASSSKDITQTFNEFKDILVRTGIIKPYEKITCAKLINHNGINYLIIKKTSAEYIVMDVTNKVFIKNKELFSKEFFIDNFDELPNYSYTAYSFDSKPGSIEPVLNYYLRNQEILSNTKSSIHYSLKDEIAESQVYYSFVTGETLIHFNTRDNTLHEQIYTYIDFNPIDVTQEEYVARIKNIKCPKEKIPSFLKESKRLNLK